MTTTRESRKTDVEDLLTANAIRVLSIAMFLFTNISQATCHMLKYRFGRQTRGDTMIESH